MSKEIKDVEKIADKTYLITTYEKPLREQLAELKVENERLKDENFNLNHKYERLKRGVATIKQDRANKEQQLKEQSKLLERWQERAVITNGSLDSESYNQILKANTHQVCEKIRLELSKIEDTLINLGNAKEDALIFFSHILNTIEKGENDNAKKDNS